MRRVVATVAVISGVGLIVLPFALTLFSRAEGSQRVLDRFRTTMSSQGLHQLATNFGTMGAAIDQFTGQTSPRLARELRMTPTQFAAYEQRTAPSVSAAVKGIPPLVAFVAPVNTTLQKLHPEFASVDSLPFPGLQVTTVPWLLIALGLVLLVLAAWLLRARGRAPLTAAAGLGLALLVLPLALSYPAKASDARRVSTVGRVALSHVAVSGATKATMLIDGLVTGVRTELVPSVAQRLGTTTAHLNATIARDYPHVAGGLAAWPSIKPGAVHLVAIQGASVADAGRLNGINFKLLPWYIMGPGIALLALSSAALLVDRREGARPRVSSEAAAG